MKVHLIVDGSPVGAQLLSADTALFRVILPAQEIRVVFGSSRPSDIDISQDKRRLGVALYGMRWQQGWTVVDVPVSSPGFLDGFYHVEQHSPKEGLYRWTNVMQGFRRTVLPDFTGEVFLSLTLKGWTGSGFQPSADSVLDAFESLGDNCEFALAQRHYNVELPLGLLRWSGTSYEKLLSGLRNGFEGLGDLSSTEVAWDTTDYRLLTPYLRMHTTTTDVPDPDSLRLMQAVALLEEHFEVEIDAAGLDELSHIRDLVAVTARGRRTGTCLKPDICAYATSRA